jgi:hypothetical protein
MSANTQQWCTRRLAQGDLLKLDVHAGQTVMCCAGTVWITQRGDVRDTFLRAGERFTFERAGLALISVEEGPKNEWMEDMRFAVISVPEALVCADAVALRQRKPAPWRFRFSR